MPIDFEYVTHCCYGRSVVFALDRAATDAYAAGLRQGPRLHPYLPYILRRARAAGRPFKVVDVGANIGTVSLPLAANGVRVLAVEALPANVLALSAAIRANGFDNLLPAALAVFDAPGLVSLAGGSAWATIGRPGGATTAACDTLPNILDTYGFGDADLIKMDIEGAELPALGPAEAFFAGRPAVEVIYESNNHTCGFFGYDRRDLMRWFEERGFRNYAFRADGSLAPVCAADPQPRPVTDVLAARCEAASLRARGELVAPMTDAEVLRGLCDISRHPHPHVRAHFVAEAARVGPRARRLPLWGRIADALEHPPAAPPRRRLPGPAAAAGE